MLSRNLGIAHRLVYFGPDSYQYHVVHLEAEYTISKEATLDIIDQYTNKGVNVIENASLENSGNYFAFMSRFYG